MFAAFVPIFRRTSNTVNVNRLVEMARVRRLRAMAIRNIVLATFILTAACSIAENWPSFRGPHAHGVSDGQNLPVKWNASKDEGILFKVKVPGLAHSSPIVSDNRLFLTTAVSSITDPTFKPGLYGAGTAAAERAVHEWRVICLHKRTGKMLWSRVSVKKKPTDKRHIKATYANSTPVTDGERVVAFFGSEGVFASQTAHRSPTAP